MYGLKNVLLVDIGASHLSINQIVFQGRCCNFDRRLLYQTSEELADWYFRNGCPALAACCHLAVEDQKVRLLRKLAKKQLLFETILSDSFSLH